MILIGCISYFDFTVSDIGIGEDDAAAKRVMEKCGFCDTGKTNYCSHLYHGDERPVHIMRLAMMLKFTDF